MDKEKFYTPQEISDIYKVKKSTVYFWIREGKLKSFRLGNLIRVSKTDLEEFIKQSSER